MKRLYILAGANGSGKSTISKVLLPSEGIVYVNPDDIAVAGYETVIAYVFVDSPEVCIARIAARVKNGGHYVPDEDVRRRYQRSKENFIHLYAPLVDHWMLYYNGGTDGILVAHGNGEINVVLKERYEAFMEGICRK